MKLPKEWLEQWEIFKEDYNRYVDGDPKVPFHVFRHSLSAFMVETDLMVQLSEREAKRKADAKGR